MKISQALKFYSNQLDSYSDTPKLDCELLITHVTQKSKSYLYTWPDHVLSDARIKEIKHLISLRKQGLSIARIIGKTEFWDLEFLVNEHTLVPRADTETVIETMLDKYAPDEYLSILDLGTGSGIIGITLANIFKNSFVIATDISQEALDIAKQNAQLNSISNIVFIQSNWFDKFDHTNQFDIIVSNPPYISKVDKAVELNVKNHEPSIALFSEDNGYADLIIIIRESFNHLKSSGLLMLEHGYQQGHNITSILNQNGYANISAHYDLNNIHRVTSANK